ncbi:glycerol dehydrogenase [Lachnospiraceae bacterium ZAX-1]
MTQIMGCCNRYVQGYGELDNLKKHISWMGSRFLVMASKNRLASLRERIAQAMGAETNLTFAQFDGECSWDTINPLIALAKECGADAVLGIGGGKVADAAKVVAYKSGAASVIIPTVASSDASTSSASLIYDDHGVMVDKLSYHKSPELVLVDTQIILHAPVRLFVSGMGDALSTYVGAKVCQDNYFDSHFDAKGTRTALEIAKLSYELLLEYGLQAKKAVEQKAYTHAFNTITEVNILMSGLGFENNGSSSDHCFFSSMQALTERRPHAYHGEGVAFSTCCQFVMQGTENIALDRHFRFCLDVGLPITFEDLGLFEPTEEELSIMTKEALKKTSMRKQPFEVTYEKVYGAYKTADSIGKLYKSGGRLA